MAFMLKLQSGGWRCPILNLNSCFKLNSTTGCRDNCHLEVYAAAPTLHLSHKCPNSKKLIVAAARLTCFLLAGVSAHKFKMVLWRKKHQSVSFSAMLP